MRVSKKVRVGAVGVAGMLALSGCLASNSKTGGDLGANKNTSKTINILVGFSGPQFDSFKSGVDPYAKAQGIKINWASDANFNADVVNKVKSGNLPDIAMFPQPGIMADLAKQGKLADLSKVMDVKKLKTQLVAGIEDVGTVNGKVYAIPPSINVKSLVFYPKKAWAASNLTAPTTLDDMLKFSDTLKNSGKTPWCMGIESGTATGWPATDWMEQLVLNYNGIDKYNQWVQHKIKFDSPEVKKAADYFQKIFGTPGYVYGGQKAIAGQAFGTAGNPMFAVGNTESKPGCYMFKQGNFITGAGFFPSSIIKDMDSNVGVFPFPGQTASDKPLEGGGDVAALFSGKNKSAIKILKYMLTPNFCTACPKSFAYISPFKSFAMSNYPNKLSQQMAKIAYDATSFAFDGSDAMPGAVGSGSFWKQMTAWINGSTSQGAALKAIDASWPATK